MTLAEIPYSKSEINEAGRHLAGMQAGIVSNATIAEAFDKVQAWRASHLHPTRVVNFLVRQKAKEIDSSALVYRRLKRMESIISKLKRSPKGTQITTMQDIGGCRAVLQTLEGVNRLSEYCIEITGEPVADYIANPKMDGYRSKHFVARYESSIPQTKHLDGRRTEIQIRTRLQHQWATAVETVDFFTKQTLKIGGGSQKWRRFFALVGSIFAGKENCPLVPNTPHALSELVDETYSLWRELQVAPLVYNWSSIVNFLMKFPEIAEGKAKPPSNSMYMVELDTKRRHTSIEVFFPEKVVDAQVKYAEKEKEITGDPNRHVVLVSVDSIGELRDAYPSYYGDAQEFIKEVAAVLSLSEKPIL